MSYSALRTNIDQLLFLSKLSSYLSALYSKPRAVFATMFTSVTPIPALLSPAGLSFWTVCICPNLLIPESCSLGSPSVGWGGGVCALILPHSLHTDTKLQGRTLHFRQPLLSCMQFTTC